MKYKIGDKVRVREDLEAGKYYNECYFNSSMATQAGKVVTIKDVYEYVEGYYFIKEFGYAWGSKMFSGLADESRNLMPLIAKELDVEMGEEFEISNKVCVYKFTEDGLKGNYYGTYNTFSIFFDLITGKEKIIKLPKKPKITEAGRVILENLPKKYKYIVRDYCGALYVYEDKPKKEGKEWIRDVIGSRFDNLSLFQHLFQLVKWEDKEPYNIEELLKGESL